MAKPKLSRHFYHLSQQHPSASALLLVHILLLRRRRGNHDRLPLLRVGWPQQCVAAGGPRPSPLMAEFLWEATVHAAGPAVSGRRQQPRHRRICARAREEALRGVGRRPPAPPPRTPALAAGALRGLGQVLHSVAVFEEKNVLAHSCATSALRRRWT